MILEFASRNFDGIPHLHEKIQHILTLLEAHFTTSHHTYDVASSPSTLVSAVLNFAESNPLLVNPILLQAFQNNAKERLNNHEVPQQEVITHVQVLDKIRTFTPTHEV